MALNIDLSEETVDQLPALVQRANSALAGIATADQLQIMVAGSQHIVAITNKAGRDQAHGASMALARTRVAITKKGKEARDDANAFCKAVIAAERELTAIISPEEKRLDAIIEGWDAEREREKQARERAEANRIAGIRDDISKMRELPLRLAIADLEPIEVAIEKLELREIGDTYGEFVVEAVETRAAVVAELKALYARRAETLEREAREKAEREAERRRVAEERAELEARRKEQDAREAAEKAERARQKAEDDARAAEVRAQQEAAQEALREAQRKIDEANAKLAADQKKLDDERRADAERKEREAREAAQREADAKRDAEIEARRRESRRTRERPAAEDVVGAVAETFDTDADIALAWIEWASTEIRNREFDQPHRGHDSGDFDGGFQ